MSWLSNLWFNYVWASLKGNGPEAVVQTIVYGLIAVAIWPPARKWIQRENATLHAKLNHVIRSSKTIPNEVPGVPPEHQP